MIGLKVMRIIKEADSSTEGERRYGMDELKLSFKMEIFDLIVIKYK